MKVSMVLPSVRLAVGTMPVQDQPTLLFGCLLEADTGACLDSGQSSFGAPWPAVVSRCDTVAYEANLACIDSFGGKVCYRYE